MNIISPNSAAFRKLTSGDFGAYYGLAPLFRSGCSYSS